MVAVGSLGLVRLYVLCISRCDSIVLLLQIPIQVTTFSVQIPLPAPTSECGGMLIIGSQKIGSLSDRMERHARYASRK